MIEVYPIHEEIEEQFNEIRHRIFRLQNGRGLDSMKRIGVSTDGQNGASYVSLKTLSQHYQPNLDLALRLWGIRRREEQIVACFLLPNSMVIKEKITQLLRLCLNFEIAEYFGTIVLSTREDIETIVQEFLLSDDPVLQIAALTAMARNRIVKKTTTIFTAPYIQNIAHTAWKDKYVERVFERLKTSAGI